MAQMREILFRGRRKFSGEWVYGSLVHIGEFCAIVEHDQERLHFLDQIYLDKDSGDMDGHATKVPRETVGQYTGLKDKNGQKIFEGDIFEHCDEYRYVVYWSADELMFRAAEIGGLKDDDYIGNFVNAYCKVIGNIHDNPELLEGVTPI